MKQKFIKTLLVCLLFSSAVVAQKNVVKIAPISLAFMRISPSYERVITDWMSVGLVYDLQLSRNSPKSVFAYDNAEYQLDAFKFRGYRYAPEIRFYPGEKAPTGFYVGPYFRYSNLTIDAAGNGVDNNGDPHENTLDATFKQVGGGVMIGAQWIVSDWFAIDFNFFGLGIAATTITADFTGTNYTIDDYASVAEDFETTWEETLLPGTLDVTYDNTSAQGTFKGILPGFRVSLRVGIGF